MNHARTVELGHIAAMGFAAVLLLSAHQYFTDHPIFASILVAAFAPVYYVASRLTGRRYFLYSFLVLLITAYNLLLLGISVRPVHLWIYSLGPIAALYGVAKLRYLDGIERGEESCYGVGAAMIALFAGITLLYAPGLSHQSPTVVAVTFAGYTGYWLLRFRDTRRLGQLVWAIACALLAFVFLLHSRSALALLIAAAVVARLSYEMHVARGRHIPEALFYAAATIFLVLQAFVGDTQPRLVLGYATAMLAMFQVALTFHRRGELKTVLPVLGGGAVVGAVPLYLLYPYDNFLVTMLYLVLLLASFMEAAGGLRERERSAVGLGLARLFGACARVVLVLTIAYITWKGVLGGGGPTVVLLAFAYLTALAGARTPASICKRRSLYVYFTGVFLSIANGLAFSSLALPNVLAAILVSGVALVAAVLAAGYTFRSELRAPLLMTAYDVATVVAIGGALTQAARAPEDLASQIVVALLLAAVSGLALIRVRVDAVVYPALVGLGLVLYGGSAAASLGGEALGIPFLTLGCAAAAGAVLATRRGPRAQNLLLFGSHLYLAASLFLFYPFSGIGAYGAALAAVPLLLLAGLSFVRSDRPLALVMESAGHLIAAALILYLVLAGSYLQAGTAMLIYAALYSCLCWRDRQKWYLFPGAFCAAVGYFLVLFSFDVWRLYFVYFIPVAVFLAALVVFLRRRGLSGYALPITLAVAVSSGAGALLLLNLAPPGYAVAGIIAGLAYLVLYTALVRWAAEPAFLAGVGLSAVFTIYYTLAHVPLATASYRLALVVPISLLLIAAGWRQQGIERNRGRWGLYAGGMVVAMLAQLAALRLDQTPGSASWLVFLISMVVWLVLLILTRSEAFIYLATLALGMLAFALLEGTTDRFGWHMFSFFLYGTGLLGLVFAVAAARNLFRMRRPIVFLERGAWGRPFLYLPAIVAIVAVTFMAFSVDYTSSPGFCGLCHSMKRYYANWQTSQHARAWVPCSSCHYEPGLAGYAKAKMEGFSELVKTITGTAQYKPEAVVSDRSCLRGGCHSVERLGAVSNRRFVFDHRIHVGAEVAGLEMRCTSCHSKVGVETHFAVDEQVCYTCHLSARGEISRSCIACHGVPEGAVGRTRFDHALAVESRDDAGCRQCHAFAPESLSRLEYSRCSTCHLEPADELARTDPIIIHRNHVTARSIKCGNCHSYVDKQDHATS